MVNNNAEINELRSALDQEKALRQQIQGKYAQLEMQFRSTVEMQTDLITLSKPDGTVLYMNRANCEFFGKTLDQMNGKSFTALVPEEDRKRTLEVFCSVSVEKPIVVNRHQVINGKGEIRWMEWINRGIFDERGHLETVLANGRDITNQVKADEARKIAEEDAKLLLAKTTELNQLKSNIITLTSHELKTPLTAIYGWVKFIQSMKQRGKNLDEIIDAEIISSLVRNAERLDNLITTYLDVSRIESNHLHLEIDPVDAAAIVGSAIQLVSPLAREKDMQILVSGKSETIAVDATRFEQVLTNLLSNAIKYSPEHATIKVQFEVQVVDPSRRRFIIKVQDEGYGFTAEELRVAMEPFPNIYNLRREKANVKGTGLGLYISRKIIEKHGGRLSISSDGPNKGSVVNVTIPLK